MTDIVVCFATGLEAEGFPRTIGGRSLTVLETGIGTVNAAFALTRHLLEHPAAAVISCGIAGAYPVSGLVPGDVVCAESETYGDLGSESPEGFLDMEAIGFPLIEGPPRVYNDLPLDLFPAARRARFVTVSTCTGTDRRAVEMAGRTGAAVESMEGAAIVHVARLLGVKVGEVRGISNTAGDRDRRRWRVEEAADAARTTLAAWIEAGGC
jgi:futalosine hydrolase